jgi:hypothetical protein
MSDQATLGPTPAPPPAPSPPGRRRGRARLAGSLAVVLVAVVATLALRSAHRGGLDEAVAPAVPVAWGRPAVSADGLALRTGVTITQVAVTGGGGLVDLRYKVTDPDRANALHDRTTPPALVDERTGLVLNQLLMNHAHTGEMKLAVTYYLVFDNPGNWVQRGSKVTVLLGNAQVEHVVVA